jgi:hypothetical protein
MRSPRRSGTTTRRGFIPQSKCRRRYSPSGRKIFQSSVFLGDKDIALAMIEAGLAEVHRGPESDLYQIERGIMR